jgi:murein DD-endopeptidase MepM/ murein hydrolase activator NlpD
MLFISYKGGQSRKLILKIKLKEYRIFTYKYSILIKNYIIFISYKTYGYYLTIKNKIINIIKIAFKIIFSIVLFVRNIFIFAYLFTKAFLLTIIYIFSAKFRKNIKAFFMHINLNKKNYYKKIKFKIFSESKLILIFFKQALISFFNFIIFDLLQIKDIVYFIKNNKKQSSFIFTCLVFIVSTSIYYIKNPNIYKQTMGKYKDINFLSINDSIFKILNSDFLKPYSVFKIALNPDNNSLEEILLNNKIEKENIRQIISVASQSYSKIVNKPISDSLIINAIINYSKTNKTYTIVKLTLPIDNSYDLIISQNEDLKYTTAVIEKELTRYVLKRKVSIQGNLYKSLIDIGTPPYIANEALKILAWDVDFQRGLKANDSVEIIYECLYNNEDEVVMCDNLLYLVLKAQNYNINIYKYENNYYHQNGYSVSKTLMLTPVNNARLSSGFGFRKHPILGYNILHKGIDFAAPIGTPIYASGNGVILSMSFSSGYGYHIRIKHNNYVQTLYAHLNSFVKNLKVGDSVKQWQLIGYTGMSGLSTGPHLHYEVIVNNRQVNPLALKSPSETKLIGRDLRKFYIYKSSFDNFSIRTPSQNKSNIIFNAPNTDTIF